MNAQILCMILSGVAIGLSLVAIVVAVAAKRGQEARGPMEDDDFDARRRALLRLARPQDLIDADGELIDLHDAGFWLWRYAALMQVVDRQDGPPPDLDTAALAELRQLIETGRVPDRC